MKKMKKVGRRVIICRPTKIGGWSNSLAGFNFCVYFYFCFRVCDKKIVLSFSYFISEYLLKFKLNYLN